MAQLIAVGLTRKAILTRVRRGFLHPVHRGVYAVGHRPMTPEAHWLAAVLACAADAVLSHRSAAALWGIRASFAAAIDVTSTRRRGYALKGVALHRGTTLAPEDRTVRNAIPVTSLPRTIIDLAGVIPRSGLEYAIHRAEARRMVSPAELREILARLPVTTPGTAAVRAIVGSQDHELDARTRSPFERRFLGICRAHGIPLPRVNEWIPLNIAAGGLEVDFSWPDCRVVVEVDEDASHTTMRARRNDPERDRALGAAGWHVTRVAEEDFDQPSEVASKVLRALGA